MIRLSKIILLVSSALVISVSIVSAEDITITTYYPSPYGSYNELTTTGNTYLATTSGSVGIGTTEPGYKLDVTGNINGSTGVYDAGNRVYSASNPPSSVQGGFGGMYTVADTSQACNYANPITGACSCPSGFTGAVVGDYHYTGLNPMLYASLYMCYR